MTRRIDLCQVAVAPRRRHQPLDRLRIAPVQHGRLADRVDPFFVDVELVGLDRAQAVVPHPVAIAGLDQGQQGGVELVRIDAHQGRADPLVGQVGVVGNAAAELALDLTVVDPPVDEGPHLFQVLDLAEGPQRNARRRRGLGEGGQGLGRVPLAPVGPALDIVGIDPQQVGQVQIEAVEQGQVARDLAFLDQEAIAVLDLHQPVGDMLGPGGVAVLEDEPHGHPVQAPGAEVGGRRRNGQVEAVVVVQHPVARIQEHRPRLARLDRDIDVQQVAQGPGRILDPDVQRYQPVRARRRRQGRDIQHQPVETPRLLIAERRHIADEGATRASTPELDRDHDMGDGSRTAERRRARGGGGTGGKGGDGVAFLGRIAPGDEGRQVVGGDIGRLHPRAHDIAIVADAVGHAPGRDVVDADLLDRGLLLDIDEADGPAVAALDARRRALGSARAASQGLGGAGVHDLAGCDGGIDGRQGAEGRALDLHLVPRLVRQEPGRRLAAHGIDVPVRQDEIVVASGQARPVVDAGPGRLADPVVAEHQPLGDVALVGELDPSDARHRIGQIGRRTLIEAEAAIPGGPPVGRCRCLNRVGGRAHQSLNLALIQRVVIDAQVVIVGAAREAVAAVDLDRRHDPARRAELIQRGVQHRRGPRRRDPLAVDIEDDALRLVPAEGQMHPGVGCGHLRHLPRHPDAGQIGVGDEGVEPFAVPVNPQERHVPAGMVGVPDPEQDEGRRPGRVPGPPVEGDRASLGIDVAGRGPGQLLVVAALEIAAVGTAGGFQGDLVGEGGLGLTRRHVRRRPRIGRHPEQQSVAGRGGALCLGQGRQGEPGQKRGHAGGGAKSKHDCTSASSLCGSIDRLCSGYDTGVSKQAV